MIIGTGGSRIVRRKTLLEVSKSPTNEDVSKKDKEEDVRPAAGRARSNSDFTAQTKPRSVKMKTFEPTVGRGESSKMTSNKEAHEKGRGVKDGVKVDSVRKIDGFKSAWTNIVNIEDAKTIARTQKQTLRKFEETNEMLHQFNNLSDLTFIEIQSCYKTHIAVLSTLKDDLDNIFHRVRSLKGKLKDQYPDAFTATSDAIETLKERQRMAMELDPNQDTNLYATAKLPDYSEAPSVLVPMDSEFSVVPAPIASSENECDRDPGTQQTEERMNEGGTEIVKSKIDINPESEQDMVVEMNVLRLDSVENDDTELVQCDKNKVMLAAESIGNEQQEFNENKDSENVDLPTKHDNVQDEANVFDKYHEKKIEDPADNLVVSHATEETSWLSGNLENRDLTNNKENNDTVPTESGITACSDLTDEDIKILETSDGDLKQTPNISNTVPSKNSIEKTRSDSETIDSSKDDDQIELTDVDSRMEDSS